MDVFKSILVWIIGICFMVILFPLTFLIWLLVLPFDKNRVIVHRLLVNQSFILTRIMPVWGIKTQGREEAIPGATYVLISNHQSMLDILIINSLRYNYKWISKIENEKVPFLGWYLKMADYITVNRGNEESKVEMLERSLACLKGGTSIMLFPEGTRSADNEIGFFKRGAFQLAIQAGVPILPIVLDGTGGILPKHGLIFGSGHHIKVRVFDPVMPESFGTTNPDELALKFSNMMKKWLSEIREESE
ncbi:MAG: 1-acyl-sn-glycerol-3-phosphate acyltransferase [Bacteroidales bacterium]|nr:1-acyl-sn-glycerol-3-phosphate acyltransferase [Bacteroidales bacterium]